MNGSHSASFGARCSERNHAAIPKVYQHNQLRLVEMPELQRIKSK
jgi:hypothetical protein